MPANPIEQFEAAFADYQEAAAARAFWMGRIGLYAVLKALGVGPDDRVGICSYTCVGVVEAVTRLRARPVFLDVDRHMNISPAALEQQARPLKALVLQHTFGLPCDLKRSLEWAQRTHIPVIEDCCHALGAASDGQRVGRFGLAAIFSFQWGKPFSTGQGGMVTFNDAALAAEVDRLCKPEAVQPWPRQCVSLSLQRQLFRWLVTPRTRKAIKAVYHWAGRSGLVAGSEPSSADLVGHEAGFLRRPCRSQARVGLRAMRRWPALMQQRNDNAAWIASQLIEGAFALEPPPPGSRPMYLRLPLWIRHKAELLRRADEENLDIAGCYSTPAHPYTGQILQDLGYEPAACPTTEAAFHSVVTLPTWPALRPAQLERAVQLLRDAQ